MIVVVMLVTVSHVILMVVAMAVLFGVGVHVVVGVRVYYCCYLWCCDCYHC